jgi:hypothetical protein
MVNLSDVLAKVMTEIGDVFIIVTFFSALMVFMINIVISRSSPLRKIPVYFHVVGWIGFLISYGGLVAYSRVDVTGQSIGLFIEMPLMVATLVLYFAFSMLLMGAAWTLRSRRILRKEAEALQQESLAQTAAV